MPKISNAALSSAIWKVARAWVGGDITDIEWRALMKTALMLRARLFTKYYSLSAKELAAAACQHYFSH